MLDHAVFRRCAALAVALVVHLLLIAGWAQLTFNRKTTAAHQIERRSALTFIETPSSQSPSRLTPSLRVDDHHETAESTAIAIPPPAPPSTTADESVAPRIDWAREAGRSARVLVDEAGRPGHRRFGEPATIDAPPAPKAFEWDPEPSRVGVSGGLPFVRLGKRCVIGLGFFGCALGDLPEANGQLFEGMRDPNRHESSVPDPP